MSQAIAEITAFEVQKPMFSLPQHESIRWTAEAHTRAESMRTNGSTQNEKSAYQIEKLFSRYGVNPSIIGFRSFDLNDLNNHNWEELEIYRFGDELCNNSKLSPYGKNINARTDYFLRKSSEVFRRFYPPIKPPPSHIIHVTCTGYASPSPAQRLINENSWSDTTNVTHAYHMGCYASMPAIRMGEGFISAMKNRNMNTSLTQVDIVHTEICSLHMNPLVHSPEQIVVQTLFADGHIKYSLVPSGTAKCGLAILNIKEQVIQDSGDDMSWIPETWGMQMTLSRDVPKKIAANLKQFLDKLVAPTKLLTAEVLLKATFAIHPGGPKIIEAVQKAFELQDAQLEKSKEVLFHHGNMSSATLPHVWKVILEEGLSPGHIVVSLAFGPGLTLFGAVFRII